MSRMSEKAFEQGLFKDKENYIEWLESKLDLIYENNNNANIVISFFISLELSFLLYDYSHL